MSKEITVVLSEKERQFLLNVLIKLPITVTLENIGNNKTVEELTTLVKKLHGDELKSDEADDTIRDREE